MSTELVKLHFSLDAADWHNCPGETVWAAPLKDDGSGHIIFELKNSPFFAKGVSYLDLVKGVNIGGQYEFAGTLVPSGHSTYRLIVNKDAGEFSDWWQRLHSLGCSFESADFMGKKLFAVDVPESADIYDVYRILEEGERKDIWLFEEGHVGHRIKDQPLGQAH